MTPNAELERIIAFAIETAPRKRMTWRDYASGRLRSRFDPQAAAKNVLVELHVFHYEVVSHNDRSGAP